MNQCYQVSARIGARIMALRFLRYGVVAILLVAIVTSFTQASVLRLVPISEIGNSQALGVPRNSVAWVGENGAAGECFADNGAILDEAVAEAVKASKDEIRENAIASAPAPIAPLAMRTSTVSVAQLGDATGDNAVDYEDLIAVQTNWQLGVSSPIVGLGATNGDFNNDGQVDVSDLAILANNWGMGTETTVVPESSTAILLLCGFGFLAFRRYFRRA